MFKKRTVKKLQQKPSTTDLEKDSLSSNKETNIVPATDKKRSLSSKHTDETASLENDQQDSLKLLQPKKKLKLKQFEKVLINEETREEKEQTLSQRQQSETDLKEHFDETTDQDQKPANDNSTYHKVNVLVDYQPDVCKDYKLTGFCGYGDSCKFIHSRDDFIQGSKLSIDWKTGQPKSTQSQDKGIPTRCVICQKEYSKPVSTEWQHYFCQKCFLQRLEKTPECFVCGKNTHGVMKPASKILKRK